jgi:hypothetical protein
MKLRMILGLSSALCLCVITAQAQETNDVEQLKQQLRQLQENFEKVQNDQRRQIEALTKKLDALAPPPAATNPAGPPVDGQRKPEAPPAAPTGTTNSAPASGTAALAKSWSPADPITVARAGSAYMNISFDALMDVGGSTVANPSEKLELGDHDPINNGFSLRNAEIAVDGAVDPYFKGYGNIVYKLDENNESSVELEEAYAMTTSLPDNLQVKAGQFFAAFGRQNAQHPHQWSFVDQPLILNRTFGPDGLRNVGAQLSWLAPTPFYTEASLGIFNGQGGTAFNFRNQGEPDSLGVDRVHGYATTDRTLRGPGDMLFVPHITTSFDLTDHQTLVAGASAAFGPNDTGAAADTQIYGLDLYWKWKPANANAGFPFVSWQTEALYQRFSAPADPVGPPPLTALPAQTLKDYGLYSQVLWGFKERWVAGLRGEYADGNSSPYDPYDVCRNERTRLSPVLTFYPSEFSKIRLQYNLDHGELTGTQSSVWLQFEFMLGAHGAHKF